MTAAPDPLASIAALPLWAGKPRFDVLVGGISNLSYVATDARGKYVVRLTRDFPFHDVYRDREVAVARAAHAAGFAPELVHAASGVMVTRYLEAETLTAPRVRRDIARIADLVRRFHREMTPGEFGFDVFTVNRGYLRQLAGHSAASRLSRWGEINERLGRTALHMTPMFGHHDLLPGNLLDDGKRLWLIDFEYAGRGDALFDLGNLSSNSGFTPAQSRDLLAAYFERDANDALIAAHRAMEAASLLREGLWSLVSKLHIHERNVDYVGYAEQNFARMDEVLLTI